MGINYNRKRILTDNLSLLLDLSNAKSTGTTLNNVVNTLSYFTLSGSYTIDNGYIRFDGGRAVSDNSTFLKWQNWNQMTFTVMFRHLSSSGGTGEGNRQYIIDSRHNGGISGLLGLWVDHPDTSTRALTLSYNTTGTSYEESVITDYNFNEWNIYQFTFNKLLTTDNIRHWFNNVNVLNRSVDASSSASHSGDNITIAEFSGASSYNFHGDIAYMAIRTDKILSEQELEEEYQMLNKRNF